MNKIAFLFPGQASQFVGMGKEFYDNFEIAKTLFAKANDVLGFDIAKLCFEGPEEDLTKTEITQPAIFTVSAIAFELLKEKGINPEAAAGHSLGEYGALYAAGAINFEDGVKILNLRGKFMQEAVPAGEGAMAAIIGLEKTAIETALMGAQSAGVVEIANINSPEQIVISGSAEAVKKGSEFCLGLGASKAVALKVSAPFHCSLMKSAQEKLAAELNKLTLNDAQFPVLVNVKADYSQTAPDLRQALIDQVSSPVLWLDSMNKFIADGFDLFVEVGPGKVLSGLLKKIDRKAKVMQAGDLESLDKLFKSLQEARS